MSITQNAYLSDLESPQKPKSSNGKKRKSIDSSSASPIKYPESPKTLKRVKLFDAAPAISNSELDTKDTNEEIEVMKIAFQRMQETLAKLQAEKLELQNSSSLAMAEKAKLEKQLWETQQSEQALKKLVQKKIAAIEDLVKFLDEEFLKIEAKAKADRKILLEEINVLQARIKEFEEQNKASEQEKKEVQKVFEEHVFKAMMLSGNM